MGILTAVLLSSLVWGSVWDNLTNVVSINWRQSNHYYHFKRECLGYVISDRIFISIATCVRRIPKWSDPLENLHVSYPLNLSQSVQVINVAHSEVVNQLYLGQFVNPIPVDEPGFPVPGGLFVGPIEDQPRALVMLSLTGNLVSNTNTPLDLWRNPCLLGGLMGLKLILTESNQVALAGMFNCQPIKSEISALEIESILESQGILVPIFHR